MADREAVEAVIRDNRRWVELHAHNEFQCEAARRVRLLCDLLAEAVDR